MRSIVLVREPVSDLRQPRELVTLSRLEACLAGEVLTRNGKLERSCRHRRGSSAPYGGSGSPCAKLMRERPAQVVYGPGTFLNRAVAAVNSELGLVRAADQRRVARAAGAATGSRWPADSRAERLRRPRRSPRPRSRPSG